VLSDATRKKIGHFKPKKLDEKLFFRASENSKGNGSVGIVGE
jgi:hypothetical protein